MTIPSYALTQVLNDWHLWPILNTCIQSECEFKKLEQGLTNENWLVTLPFEDKSQFVIRINAVNAASLNIHHPSEYDIVDRVSALRMCPKVLYQNPNFKYWVRPYIHGNTLGEHIECGTPIDDTLTCIANLLCNLHKQPINTNWPVINLLERTEHYWQQLTPNPLLNTRNILTLKQRLDAALHISPSDTHQVATALCHMDANIDNWIKTNDGQLQLIDWEYAGIGNPIWDLATFCDSARLSSAQEHALLNAYGDYSFIQLQQAKRQMEYLSILWFALQENTDSNTFTCELQNLAARL